MHLAGVGGGVAKMKPLFVLGHCISPRGGIPLDCDPNGVGGIMPWSASFPKGVVERKMGKFKCPDGVHRPSLPGVAGLGGRRRSPGGAPM